MEHTHTRPRGRVVSDAAELLAAVDTTRDDLERARQAVRVAIEERTAAALRHRAAVEAFDTWSKAPLS